MSVTITEQLYRIQKDIMYNLAEANEPMTQDELHLVTKLKNISWYGWPFALDNLEREGYITMTGRNSWEMTPEGMMKFSSIDSDY